MWKTQALKETHPMAAYEPTDEELMLSAQAGSTESFEALVVRHRNSVVRFLLRMHGDLDLAEDACQETFVRAWIYRSQYVSSGRFIAYLLQIARNVMLGKLRRKGLEISDLPEDMPEIPDGSTSHSPELELLKEDRHSKTLQAIDALPPHLGEVFVMVAVDGLKYVEAAEKLEVPLGTIKSRMHEAVKRLRSALLEEGLI